MTTPTTQQREDRNAVVAATALQLATAWANLYRAQLSLLATLEQHRSEPALGATQRLKAAIQRFLTSVGTFDRNARAAVERWAAQDLPIFYRDGALTSLDKATDTIRRAAAAFAWSEKHQGAVTALSAQYYTDLFGRITETVRRAQAFARAAQDQARSLEGIDRGQLLDQFPLGTIVYRNDARHPIDSWARGALAVQATQTRNAAALNYGAWDLGTQWFECADGPECGWAGHQDTDHADGTIRSAEDASEWPTSHYGCIRSWTPRPDLNGTPDLESGDPI
ncbi:hypothetical protein [Streptomyces sp. 8L]|uniref:hypothetical protein n=1 Tax=Streptomyces sp. 8L TaxID=2877242 RepID=UPI001CD1B475|nr:hypothetical protein [Streptomyces sp. 8L]MCA1220257.1 hypothetical protein [Streptomyces sp. 8L]